MSDAAINNEKPDLFIRKDNLPATAADLAKYLAAAGHLFQRGEELVKVAVAGDCAVTTLNVHSVVVETHSICRPVAEQQVKGEVVLCPQTLPERVARLYLAMPDQWGMRILDGLCSAPILMKDGSIRTARGYEPTMRYWCTGLDLPPPPERPSQEQASGALSVLREAFATFPFADRAAKSGAKIADKVDVDRGPATDESAFLAALLTAVCRPSLPLAPAILIRAPLLSGAGTGKGVLVRAVAQIAFGVSPRAFTSGGDRAELDKRVAAAMLEAAPLIFLDNVNAETVRSDLISQIITESACMVRRLHESKMARLVSNAFVAVTGNGVRVSEDLARRFLVVDLDARCENPEQRRFDDERFLDTITARRGELLRAALTIWRWGRQNDLPRGRPLGSFEQWATWVRDPLVALGCRDPVDRIDDIKHDDPHRRQVADFLSAWHHAHGDRPITIRNLDLAVRSIADLRGRSRQSVATFVSNLVNTRVGGFQLVRERHGKWGASTYVVTRTDTVED